MPSQRVATLAGIALALGACGSTAGPDQPAALSAPTTGRATTTTTAAPAAGGGAGTTTSTSPAAPPLRMGEDGTTRDGNTIRVLTYHQPLDGTVLEAGAGQEFAAVEAEICAGRRSAPRVSPDSFKVELADGTRRGRSYFGPKEPELDDTSLPSGQCVRGWISFEVPEGKRPAFVVFQGSSVIRWSAGGRPR
ncbi:MAG: hypothetical protein ACRD0N_07450 [Acidimicrobiales bacterium]